MMICSAVLYILSLFGLVLLVFSYTLAYRQQKRVHTFSNICFFISVFFVAMAATNATICRAFDLPRVLLPFPEVRAGLLLLSTFFLLYTTFRKNDRIKK